MAREELFEKKSARRKKETAGREANSAFDIGKDLDGMLSPA